MFIQPWVIDKGGEYSREEADSGEAEKEVPVDAVLSHLGVHTFFSTTEE